MLAGGSPGIDLEESSPPLRSLRGLVPSVPLRELAGHLGQPKARPSQNVLRRLCNPGSSNLAAVPLSPWDKPDKWDSNFGPTSDFFRIRRLWPAWTSPSAFFHSVRRQTGLHRFRHRQTEVYHHSSDRRFMPPALARARACGLHNPRKAPFSAGRLPLLSGLRRQWLSDVLHLSRMAVRHAQRQHHRRP
jgi:hypothetical protein